MASSSYPYAAGRIMVLEGGLISEADIERLQPLPYETARKQLLDRGFGPGAAPGADVDELAALELADTWRVVDDLSPDPALTDLFKLDVDAVNLKQLFKARLLETPPTQPLLPGAFDPELLRRCVESGNFSELPESLGAPLTELLRAWEKSGSDVAGLSAGIDNAIYGYTFAVLKQKKNALCERYFRAKADHTNLVSLLRARALSWRAGKLERMLVLGGQIPLTRFTAAAELPADALYAALRLDELSAINDDLKLALELYSKTGNIADVSALLQQRLFSVIEAERNDSFGIGPVAYYLLRRLNVVRAVRVLFAAMRPTR